MTTLAKELTRFGAPRDAVVTLDDDAPGPRTVPYLDLLRAHELRLRPAAVVEFQRRPVLYAVEGNPKIGEHVPSLRRALAFRGDAEFLAVVDPGKLTLYQVSLDQRGDDAYDVIEASDARASSQIPTLALAPPTIESATSSAIHRVLLDLLESTSANLTQTGIPADDAISLVGRALFLRFLFDRGLVTRRDTKRIAPSASKFEDCFATPRAAAETCAWLDGTFNGDLLPLPKHGARVWFDGLSHSGRTDVFTELSKILQRADARGQLQLDWGDIDFGHVPVGLLSQVYERHSQHFDPEAKASSVHYTPRTIAEYMAAEALSSFEVLDNVRVLDPAVGGGVFLVACLRYLVAERWARTGKRPDTSIIRRILNEQLVGFDINESALRLAALSLYLTALELDPSSTAISNLRFENLRGRVLFDVRAKDGLGSLRPELLADHAGKYDLVIGNPPWTSQDKLAVRSWITASRSFVEYRLGAEESARFDIPDAVPDLPFAWQSMRWAKANGRVALALHARLLFKQSDGGVLAREQLFRGLRVTGVLNGAALRQTGVWPDVTAPFCILFAENVCSQEHDLFYYLSPEREDAANQRGRMRIDSAHARPVRTGEMFHDSTVLKTLFRGTATDLNIIALIREAAKHTIGSYWHNEGLASGVGYQVGGRAGTQQDASALQGKPNLIGTNVLTAPTLNVRTLPSFRARTLLRIRDPRIYRAPLVLVRQTPPASRKRHRAILPNDDVVFDRTYFGYSTRGHTHAKEFANYLFVLFNSNIPLYYYLLTSSQFGVERDTLLKVDVDTLPFVPYDSLSSIQRAAMQEASKQIRDGAEEWGAVADRSIAAVYGLSAWHLETISDTLMTSLPHAAVRRSAQQRPTPEETDQFIARLQLELSSVFAPLNITPKVSRLPASESLPWRFISVSTGAETISKPPLEKVTRAADDIGASLVVIENRAVKTLVVGILLQRRYWTQTRARMLATSLLTEHIEALGE